jgi:hypothetical protein
MDSHEVWRYAVFLGSTFDRYDQIQLEGLADKSRSNPPPGGGCGLGFELVLPLALLARRNARSGTRRARALQNAA